MIQTQSTLCSQVCCDWREIAHTMRDRVFEEHEDEFIDIHDVKVKNC